MTLQKDPEGNERRALQKLAGFMNKRVLEIACGEGRLTWKYAASTKQVVGIDLDHESLRVAFIDRPYDLNKHILLARADSLHIPFPNETFDIAILAWSL